MHIQRRTFLAASGSMAGMLGVDPVPSRGHAANVPARPRRMARTVCPFCSVGCGAILVSEEGRLVHVEGDPDHPISAGSLCARGNAMVQLADNPRRVTSVKYRAPGAAEWEQKDWDWAVRRIAERIQATRDAHFTATDPLGRCVNRADALACLGGSSLTNEECYALAKLARALGIVYLEHEARLGHGPAVAGLGATFGSGAIGNHWIDVANSDCVMLMGSNAAETHPVAMKWIARARQKGAKLIVVDPRLTRTAAGADFHVPLRPGTDVALMGGLIREALQRGMADREWLAARTDAGFLVHPAAVFEAGRFGPIQHGGYRGDHWGYQRDAEGRVRIDPSLQDPHCVFQLLRRHFARYTLQTVSRVCGTPETKLRELAENFLATGRPGRAGAILYGSGATQHSHGTQNVRSFAVLQLLLGNMDVPGGGVHALRGGSNEQGATDHGLLFDLLPGPLICPSAEQTSLAEYLGDAEGDAAVGATVQRPSQPRWGICCLADPKHAVGLLQAWWGPHAAPGNQFAYEYLPKHDGDCSYLSMFEAMHAGRIGGLLVLGANPAASSPDAGHAREALEKLDWLVVADLWETETSNFWKRPGAAPQQIATEVFLLPAAAGIEKGGSVTSSGGWVQWRTAGVAPPGQARSELWILDCLARELKRLYAHRGVFPNPIVHLTWDYGEDGGPDPQRVAREINSQFLAEGGPRLPTFPDVRARLWASSLAGGPLPEHYEPLESPVANLLSPQPSSPPAKVWEPEKLGRGEEYPIVATTFHVGEHLGSGETSRNLPWLVELVPDAFVEISRELAQSRGIRSGDRVVVRSARGQIVLYALVTGRLKALVVDGRPIEQAAIVSQFGYEGLAVGAGAGMLAPRVADADAMAPECKAFLCQIEKEQDGRSA